jgi:hypothetical protein
MLDLCIFGITKRFLDRAKRLEKVHIQTAHIVSILESFIAAAVPHNNVACSPNAGMSLLMNEDRIVKCNATLYMTRCLLGLTFQQGLLELLPDKEEDEEPSLWEEMV